MFDAFSLPCFGCVIVTKEVTEGEATTVEGIVSDAWGDSIEVKDNSELSADGTGSVVVLLGANGLNVRLLTSGFGEGEGEGESSGGADAIEEGAGGGASSPVIGFAKFCPGRGLSAVMVGIAEGSFVIAGTSKMPEVGTSPMFDVF